MAMIFDLPFFVFLVLVNALAFLCVYVGLEYNRRIQYL